MGGLANNIALISVTITPACREIYHENCWMNDSQFSASMISCHVMWDISLSMTCKLAEIIKRLGKITVLPCIMHLHVIGGSGWAVLKVILLHLGYVIDEGDVCDVVTCVTPPLNISRRMVLHVFSSYANR